MSINKNFLTLPPILQKQIASNAQRNDTNLGAMNISYDLIQARPTNSLTALDAVPLTSKNHYKSIYSNMKAFSKRNSKNSKQYSKLA